MQALGLVWGCTDPLSDGIEEIRTHLAEPRLFGARLLLEYWRARQADDEFVIGRDVPSRELACVLRNLAIYEPLEGGSDFRLRLAGTAFTRRFGRDVTGMHLSETYDRRLFQLRRQALQEVLKSSEPAIEDVKFVRDNRVYLNFEILRLKVLCPRRDMHWVLSGIFYSDWT